MTYTPTAREIRVKEYEMCVDEYREVNRFLKWIIVTTMAGHGVLLTIFQATFPRESIDISKYLTPEHPSFAIVQIIPNIGMALSFVLMFGIFDWILRRRDVLGFGLWIETNLKISHHKNGHGFFTNVGIKKLNYYGRLFLSISIMLTVLFAWTSINKSSAKILITLKKQQRVQTQQVSGKKLPIPEFKLEKGEKK